MDTELSGVNAPESRADEINVGDHVSFLYQPPEGGCPFYEYAVVAELFEDGRDATRVKLDGWAGSFDIGTVELFRKAYEHAGEETPQDIRIEGIETLEELEALKEDIVVEPAHYTRWVIEPITYIMRNGMEFWRGNIVKYASRAGFKLYDGKDAVESEITDLKKVIRYAEMRINQLRGEITL